MRNNHSPLTLHDCFSRSPDECVVFATDLLSQPNRQHWLTLDPLLTTKCSRALVMAHSDDVVLISGRTDPSYRAWLTSVGFGTEHVIEFDCKDVQRTLAHLVIDNAELLRERIEVLGKCPVYVPFYASSLDGHAARSIDARLFGCDEHIIQKYFNKEQFKQTCRRLGLPTVSDTVPQGRGAGSLNREELAEAVDALLHTYKTLMVRGTVGSAGDSVFKVESGNAKEVLESIQRGHSSEFLVEPFLKVIASPNDQWCITEDGSIRHVGLSAQLFKGLSHVGNLHGEFFSSRVTSAVRTCSERIAAQMRDDGFRGLFGVDYIVSDDGIFPIENNARMNGSSFAFSVVDGVRRSVEVPLCWKFFKASFRPSQFEELAATLEPILFTPGKPNSAFPFDCDALSINGTFACLLVAEDLYHLEFLEGVLAEMTIRRV